MQKGGWHSLLTGRLSLDSASDEALVSSVTARSTYVAQKTACEEVATRESLALDLRFSHFVMPLICTPPKAYNLCHFHAIGKLCSNFVVFCRD